MLDLNVMNFCLLSKCLWKLENEDGLRQQILRKKYLSSQTLSQTDVIQGDSFLAGFDGS